MSAPAVSRADVLAFRVGRHQLDRRPEAAVHVTDVALLDFGVQDTGPDGAAWALAVRGAPSADTDELVYTWTLRGARHAYRRSDLEGIATATAPFSEADAGKRIFDAVKPLRAAGIATIDALGVVAGHMREIVRSSTVKGDLSSRLTDVLDEPYLRFCRPCDTTHAYEMPFRLAALQAGLELEPGTSPPVLHPVAGLAPPMYRRLAGEAAPRFDVIRNYLRFYGPARVRDVATFVDMPMKEVKAHWPSDAVEVVVSDDPTIEPRPEPRFVLAEDVDWLTNGEGDGDGDGGSDAVRLLGSHDPYLQLRDRELLVADEARRKDLWRTIGRPGAVVARGEVVATWRPRTSGRKLTLRIEPWAKLRSSVQADMKTQAERLASHRDVTLAGVTEE